jgi:hypothetical protein
MIREVIEALMGGLFRSLLAFYEAYALPLNLVVLAYGVTMLLAWQNLVRIYRYLVVAVAKQIHLNPALSAQSSVRQVGEVVAIPWTEAVKLATFPLIGSQVMPWPLPKSVGAVQRIVDQDELLRHALDVLNGTHPLRIMPTYKRMWNRRRASADAQH